MNHAKSSSLLGALHISVIPNGLNIQAFQPRDRAEARASLGLPVNASVILFISRWLYDSAKGLPMLLQALQYLGSIPELYLVTIGEGQLPAGLPAKTLSLGHVAGEDALSTAYAAADVLAVPSLQENFPSVVLEALSCGLPVVGSRVGGIPEIVRHDLTGRLVDTANPEALAGALRELIEAPERRHDMSLECRRLAIQEYDLNLQVVRYETLYQRLLSH
jgi:glycosyltransferase involved in cell wall biosynthesis